MALSWVLNNPAITSALIGASRPEQILENIRALDHLEFSDEERKRIREIVADMPAVTRDKPCVRGSAIFSRGLVYFSATIFKKFMGALSLGKPIDNRRLRRYH